ncbi:MAG: glycosyltransferase [Candidatus Aminicenantes bacterium]|nr:glycosyltransferase [Candidatus Aminicenantes bacterium]
MELMQEVILLVLVIIFLNLLKNLKRLKEQEKTKPKKPLPFVSVLVPARNEERNIENCVSSLLQSDYPKLEIIVLDDNSTDGTYGILKELSEHHKNLRVIKGKKLPPGWNGKNWACHQLSQAAQGEWFLFTDADTVHKPNSVSTALGVAQKRKSVFVSCIPRFITKTWSEKLYFPVIHFVFVALFPFKLINYSKDSRLSFAIGPFLFIKRDFYLSWGGYEAIRLEVVDDIAMARKVKENRGKISMLDGTGILDVRFYTCFKEVWNGFSKNSYEAIGGAPHVLVALLFTCYFLFIYPYISLWGAYESHQSLTIPLLQVFVIALIKLILSLRFKISIFYGQLHPFTVIFAVLILLNSFRLAVFKKKFEWKERLYPVE